ncbi:MAG: ATP synthase F1 subunit delta [bacterium]
MIHRVVASRYARALFDAAFGMKVMKTVTDEFPAFLDTINTSKDFRNFLYHPTIGAADKKRVVENAFKDKVSGVLLEFLFLVVEKKREVYLPYIWEKYRQLVMEYEGRAEAQVFTPFPLDDVQRDSLRKMLSSITGKQITIEEVKSPELIGGIRVKVGDLVMDGSLSHTLQQAREHLLSIKVH